MKTRIFLFSLILLPMVNFGQVDYRKYQSPVKNQAGRGTCTAFAILAAMETFPGFPIDLSEQYVYAMAKMKHYQEMPEYNQGAALRFYLDVLEVEGTLREDQEPYNPNAPVWDDYESSFEKMKKDLKGKTISYLLSFPAFSYKLHPNMYTYMAGVEAQNVEYIKERLDGGLRAIPVGYGLNASYWFNHEATASNPIDPSDWIIFNDGLADYGYGVAKLMFGDDLYSKVNDGSLEAYYTDTNYTCNAGHAVAIVGYNDKGFLVKNSWGTDRWGDGGYGWISYDYHKLFVQEVLILALGKVHVQDKAFRESGDWRADEFNIKSMPVTYRNEMLGMDTKGIEISVIYHGDAQMPRFDQIKYDGYDALGTHLGT